MDVAVDLVLVIVLIQKAIDQIQMMSGDQNL